MPFNGCPTDRQLDYFPNPSSRRTSGDFHVLHPLSLLNPSESSLIWNSPYGSSPGINDTRKKNSFWAYRPLIRSLNHNFTKVAFKSHRFTTHMFTVNISKFLCVTQRQGDMYHISIVDSWIHIIHNADNDVSPSMNLHQRILWKNCFIHIRPIYVENDSWILQLPVY